MADKELHELTSGTPALTDITVFGGPAGGAEVKKSTFSSIKDLLKTSYDALYQAILVSGTNIKTLNGNSILGSGNLSLPVLSDGNYTDATISSSGTVITINNGVVTNAKLANVASATFKGRTTVGTGVPEDMTATQATALLNTATTSLKGLMSSADKTKLDGLSNEWTALTNSTYTAGGTYNSGTLTTYDLYKIVISGTSTGGTTALRMRVNSDSTASSYNTYNYSTTSINNSSLVDDHFKILSHNVGSGSPLYIELIMTSSTCRVTNITGALGDGEIINWGNKAIAVTSIQLSLIQTISGKIQIFGKNF